MNVAIPASNTTVEPANAPPPASADAVPRGSSVLFKSTEKSASSPDGERVAPSHSVSDRRGSDASQGSDSSHRLQTLVEAASALQTPTKVPLAPTEEEATSAEDCSKDHEMEESEDSVPLTSMNVIQGRREDLMGAVPSRQTFSQHLMQVLDDPAQDDVLQWLPDGKSFQVVDHKKFLLDKMPKLFNIRNMSSFVRKLSRWGFSRVPTEHKGNNDIFTHPHFERGQVERCRKMVRCVGKTSMSKPENKNAAVTPEYQRKLVANHLHQNRMMQQMRSHLLGNGSHRSYGSSHSGSSASSRGSLLRYDRAGFGDLGLSRQLPMSTSAAELMYRHEQERRRFLQSFSGSNGAVSAAPSTSGDQNTKSSSPPSPSQTASATIGLSGSLGDLSGIAGLEGSLRGGLSGGPNMTPFLDGSLRGFSGLDASIRGLDCSIRSCLGDSFAGGLDRSLGGGSLRSLGDSFRSIDAFAERQLLLEQQALERRVQYEMLQQRRREQQRSLLRATSAAGSGGIPSHILSAMSSIEREEERNRRRKEAIRSLLEEEKLLHEHQLRLRNQSKYMTEANSRTLESSTPVMTNASSADSNSGGPSATSTSVSSN